MIIGIIAAIVALILILIVVIVIVVVKKKCSKKSAEGRGNASSSGSGSNEGNIITSRYYPPAINDVSVSIDHQEFDADLSVWA